MRECSHPDCDEPMPFHIIWIGQQLEWAQLGDWIRPLCAKHETAVPLEFVLIAQSRQAATMWAEPITFRRESPDDDDATTSLRDLADLMSVNPDLIHGDAGLVGADPLIHSVRAGLVAMGTEMIRAEKLQAQDLTAAKGGKDT